MKVINPTDKTLKVQIEGSVYEVEGNGVLENVPKAHAENWEERTHNFIVLEEDTVKVVEKEPKVETPKDEVVKDVPEITDGLSQVIEDEGEEVPGPIEDDTPEVEVEMSYSDMQKKASGLGMEKVIGVSKVDLTEFIKDNS